LTINHKHKLAFIVPTKDRRDDLRRLFASLEGESDLISQIVLVDGGDDMVEDLAREYGSLPIDYIRCYPPGFTKQKNTGAKALKVEMTLVGYLDDDLELGPGAVQELMRFWGEAAPDVGGTAMNITNAVVDKPNFFTKLFGTNSEHQGIVLKSGVNVVVDPVVADTEVEWLCGGATVWRREIIEKYEHDEWFAGYGHMDDMDFSLAVGGDYKMFVLRDAKCAHYDKPIVGRKNYVFGIYDTVNRHYLVKKYPQRFSISAYYWATTGKFFGRLTRAVIKRDRDSWLRAKGNFIGLVKVMTGQVGLSDTNIK